MAGSRGGDFAERSTVDGGVNFALDEPIAIINVMSVKAKIPMFVALVMSALLVLSLGLPYGAISGATLKPAYADELTDAQAALNAASADLNAVTAEYNSLQAQAAELEGQISSATSQVLEAQTAMQEGQKVLGEALCASYKSDASMSLVSIFLKSENMADFMKNIQYYSSIQEAQAQIVAEQKKLKDELEVRLADLDSKKDAQESLLNQAAEKQSQAQQIVSSASAKVANIESERARIAELQAKAAAMQQQQQQQQQQTEQKNDKPLNNNWNTAPGGNGGASAGGSNNNAGSSNNTNKIDPPASGAGGWRTGTASAYGGSSDKNTPNPGTTATGAICNDNSMGVAIPMSWKNYRSYLGRQVEIRYGGKKVVATVNDCGGMGHGSRSLDLQPGVFKAFGFKTCKDWGLRTVEFRFL